MARVSTYLNFMGTTEEAFAFYKEVFNGTYVGQMMRMGDMPASPDMPELPEDVQRKIMHIELEILAGHVLMATDMIESMGHSARIGNNTSINLEPDTREETQRLYAALSEGSTECAPLMDMFWGALWGSCLDRYGIRWMFNCYEPAPA